MLRNRRRPSSPTSPRARTLTGLAVGGAALTAIMAPLAFGSPGGGSPWSQFGHDSAHSGVSNTEQALTAANVNQLRSLFSGQLPGTADGPVTYLPGVPTPAGGKDLVFTTSRDGWITAVDARTGGIVWSHQNGPGNCHVNNGGSPCYTTSTPAVDPGNQFVYAYGLDGRVHKYAVGNGAETIGGGWPQVATLKPYDEKNSGALTIATAPGGPYLYSVNGGYPGDGGDYQGHVTTINLATGTQHVFNTLCSDNPGHIGPNGCNQRQSAVWARDGVNYDAATNKVYFATGNGLFDGVHNFGDSALAMNPDGTGTNGGPLASYTPADQSGLRGADADLGSTSPALVAAPAGSGLPHLAVQSGKDGQLRLLNLDNLGGQNRVGSLGGELQKIAVPQGGEVLTQPAAWTAPDGSSWVFVTNDSGISGLKVISTNGRPALVPQWTMGSGGTSPIVVSGVVYYLTNGGARALDPTTGRQLWADNSGTVNLHWQSPIVAGNSLYYPDGNGKLRAFTAPAATPPPPPPAPANGVHGAIADHYYGTPGLAALFGPTITPELTTPDTVGRYNHFDGGDGGSIYWTPNTGAWSVHGAIRGHWESLGWERGPTGYPLTDERTTPDGVGRYNHFTGGDGASIYWTPATGAQLVHGAIRVQYASMGWERSSLGYPTSDEYAVPGGRRSDFQHGSLTYRYSDGAILVG